MAKSKRREARRARGPRAKERAKPRHYRLARLDMALELAGELWDWLGPEATARARGDYALARPFEALARGDWRALTEESVVKYFLDANRSTLQRHCVAALGRRYVKVALDFRMEQARRLLTTGDDPVPLIAFAVGYPDVTVFRHAFARRFGVPPRQAASLKPIPGGPHQPARSTGRRPGR